MKLTHIKVQNFKSLKDVDIDFEDINIIVGPNGSGKTNLIELFELLKLIYIEKENNPFLKWWGYDHAVWNHDETLNIIVKFYFTFFGYKIQFKTDITGAGGKFRFNTETLSIENVVKIEKKGKWINFSYDRNFLKNAMAEYRLYDQDLKYPGIKQLNIQDIENQEIKLLSDNPQEFSLFLLLSSEHSAMLENYTISTVDYNDSSFLYDETGDNSNTIVKIMPAINKDAEKLNKDLYWNFKDYFFSFLGSPILKRLNFEKMKNPFRISKEKTLLMDGSNIGNVIYNLFLKKNKVPETVNFIIEHVFPDTQLLFDVTTDGRILIKAKKKGVEYFPPSLSDGFFKLLVLATVIEMDPHLIVVDEIEDSIYARVIEVILDLIVDRNIRVIFTTHSPYIVDIIHPSKLFMMENSENGTQVKKFKHPDDLKNELSRLNITLSERWLYD